MLVTCTAILKSSSKAFVQPNSVSQHLPGNIKEYFNFLTDYCPQNTASTVHACPLHMQRCGLTICIWHKNVPRHKKCQQMNEQSNGKSWISK